MNTRAINTKLLEQEIIFLAKSTGELKKALEGYQKILEECENRKHLKVYVEELFLMQEDLWQYTQQLEIVQKMYEEIGEELVSIVLSK